MAGDDETGPKPRRARGFSFLARAFRAFAGADHPAHRPITPEGFPLRVMATVAECAPRRDHTFLLLTFELDGTTWGAGVRLKPGVTAYRLGEQRPVFLDPEGGRFMFGVVTGRYEEAASLLAPMPADTPPEGFPMRVAATVVRVDDWEATSGSVADLFGPGGRSHIWRTAMTLRFEHEGRDLGAVVTLPPGSADHAPGDTLPLDLSPDAGRYSFGRETGRVHRWSDVDPDAPDEDDEDDDNTGDDPVPAPPRRLQ